MSTAVETVMHGSAMLAIIVSRDYSNQGLHFFTPDELSQQLAYMRHPKGKIIAPHVHNIVKREVLYTSEALVIKSGRVRVDFFSDQQEYLKSRVLEAGDVILLVTGGHGFEILEETEMLEIKQGPYAGDMDKIKFKASDFKINMGD